MNMHTPISARRASSFQAALSAAAAWAPLVPIANDWIAYDQERPSYEDLTSEDADRHDEFLKAVLAMEAPSIETALAKQRLFMAISGATSASSLLAEDAANAHTTLVADLEKLATTTPADLPASGLDPDADEYRATRTTLGELARMAPDNPALAGQEALMERNDTALNRMLLSAPKDVAGIEARLCAILEQAWGIDIHSGRGYREYAAKPVTVEELYGEAGCGTNDTEVIGSALARLHSGVVSLLKLAEATPCPIAPLAPRHDAIVAEEDAALEAATTARKAGKLLEAERYESKAMSLANDRYALEETAVRVDATSISGAVTQLAFAMHRAELIRGNTDQDVRDDHHTSFEVLMKSALRVLSDHISPCMWASYVGGYHPGVSASAAWPVPNLDGQFVAWEAEMARLFEAGRTAPSDAEWQRCSEAAMEFDHKIRVTPGAGVVAARVKLRALLHPEVGMINAGTAESDEVALRTILEALGGATLPTSPDAPATTEADEPPLVQAAA